MDWTVILPAGVGGIVVKAIADIVVSYIKRYRNPQQPSISDMTTQFTALLKASESYREEVRQDMDRMKKEFTELQCKYETDIQEMKETYEAEIESLRGKVSEMMKEITAYRQENGALHLLLKQKGIEVPGWVRRSSEN